MDEPSRCGVHRPGGDDNADENMRHKPLQLPVHALGHAGISA